MKQLSLLLLSALLVLGCGSSGDTGTEMSSAEMQQKLTQTQQTADLPPQARAAMQSSGRYASEYAKSQEQVQGGRGN